MIHLTEHAHVATLTKCPNCQRDATICLPCGRIYCPRFDCGILWTDPETDFTTEQQPGGTISLISPTTPAAKAWIAENVDDAIWLGDWLACDPRYFGEIIDGMVAAGLIGQRKV